MRLKIEKKRFGVKFFMQTALLILTSGVVAQFFSGQLNPLLLASGGLGTIISMAMASWIASNIGDDDDDH